MKGIGNPRIEECLHLHLPAGTTLVPAPWNEYVHFSLQQPIIQAQIDAGIYSVRTIDKELISVAWSWSSPPLVVACLDLIRWHMKEVPFELALGYAEMVGLHETHHIQNHVTECDLSEQYEREKECNAAIMATHPETVRLGEQAMEASPTISRVIARANTIIATRMIQTAGP